jgi:LysM repeat protein
MVKLRALAKLMSIPLILIFLVSVVALAANGEAQGICGPTYTVKPGDSFGSIALVCGVSYDALIAANPQISDPAAIYPGQTIHISPAIIPITGSNPAGLRSLQITPQAGPAGTQVLVSGTGFPASTSLTVGAGIVDSGPVVSQPVVSDANGGFAAQFSIPATASAQQHWAIFASQGSGDQLITVQVPFQVTAPTVASVYIVQPGDYLTEIALQFNVTLSALLQANPQIGDPNLIYPGQVIQIPAPGAVIPITGQRIYIVLWGDTLSGIAHTYGTSVAALLNANPGITNPDLIFPGQLIILPL